jgi:hypothetical protein
VERRAPVTGSKKRNGNLGQKRSELAVLLAEAQRLGTLDGYNGFQELGPWARSVGIEAATFAKYKTAGNSLRASNPELYFRVLAAIRDGTQVPDLPDVSKLAMVPSLKKKAGGEPVDIAGALSTPLRATTVISKQAAYGAADNAGRETLSKLDAHLQDLRRLQELVDAVREGRAGAMPEGLLRRRITELRAEAEWVAAEATAVLEGTLPRRCSP